MTLAPQVQAFLAASPAERLDSLPVPEQRQRIRYLSDRNYLRYGRPAEPVAAVTDHQVPVDGGHITVRAYRPGPQAPLPAHLELHGGGWWLGSIDEEVNEAICRYRCRHAGCVVVAVGYRLAPEHPFPTAIGDVYTALQWVSANAAELGIDPGLISIGGTSAGGNLAAAVTLRARDAGGPPLVFQLLDVPALDLTGETMRAAAASEVLRPVAHQIREFETPLQRYFRDPADALLPLASPVFAADLSGLPPAHIMTAEYDPLRDEGEWYARRLADAGVEVTLARHAGAIHGTGFLTAVWEPARQWQHEAATMLRSAHERAARQRLAGHSPAGSE
jgi:acetyl esterase